MPISWNEIRQNAIRFSREWAEEHREDAEAKSFWDEFFAVFGIRRRLSAPFTSDRQRIEFLFALYEQYTAPLLPVEKKNKTI